MEELLKKYNMLILIVMIYVTIDLSSLVFAYKLISVHGIILAASSAIFPLTYTIMDLVAEVYGYYIARKIIWYGFYCDIIFSFITFLIIKIPSLSNAETLSYSLVFYPLIRAVCAQAAGVLLGAYTNIFLITKWKVLLAGKHFWLRSIGSSILGEGIMLMISVVIALTGVLKLHDMFLLIAVTFCYKILFAIVVSPVAAFIAAFINRGFTIDYSIDTKSNLDAFPMIRG